MSYGKKDNSTTGLGANDYEDSLEGGQTVAYKTTVEEGGSRLYLLIGTVNIPNPEAPNDKPLAVLSIRQYVGKIIEAWKPGQTKLVLKAAGDTGQFTWE